MGEILWNEFCKLRVLWKKTIGFNWEINLWVISKENIYEPTNALHTIFRVLIHSIFFYIYLLSPASPLTSLLSLAQRRCREDWSFHHPQHRPGTNEIWGRGRHLSDGENVEDTETSYGADRGAVFFHLSNVPVSNDWFGIWTNLDCPPPQIYLVYSEENGHRFFTHLSASFLSSVDV